MKAAVVWLCLIAAVLRVNASVPVIFQILDPVKPDETLLLFGADVGVSANAEGMRLADKAVSGPPADVSTEPTGKPEKLQILQASDLSAKVLMPAEWKQGVFAVRLRNADGIGEWQFANRPQLWWQISGDGGRANPGGVLRVFGKNLGRHSRLWVVDTKGLARKIPVTIARDYDVAGELPSDLPPGVYRVWLHNGFGGVAGFGEPLTLEVAATTPWPATVFDVTRYGAVHDGQHDDTEAIRQALKDAETNGGGIVHLPSGTYIVTGKLVVPPRTILRGEKRESVWIKVPVFWPKSPQKLAELDSVIAGNGDFGVENLSVAAQPARRIIAAPDVPALYGPGMARLPASTLRADRVHLRDLRIEHLYFTHRLNEGDPRRNISEGPSTIVVNGADFSLEDSEVISAGMPIQIQSAKRARIIHNVLRTGRNGWYGLWNFTTGVFEDNDISAADLEGTYGGIQGNAAEIIFRGNHWHDAYGNEREALTFDTPYSPAWIGRASVSERALIFATMDVAHWPPPQDYPPELLAVVASGRGVGQAVPVAGVAITGVTLEHLFKVTPDSTSIIAVTARKSRVIVADNRVEGASVAFQLYAQAHEFIIANNHCIRTGGSYSRAGEYLGSADQHCYSYSLFNQWLHNTFTEGLVYEQGPWAHGFVGHEVFRSPEFQETTPAIGDRFEGNQLLGGTQMGAVSRGSGPKISSTFSALPLARDTIFETNRIVSRPIAISLDQGHRFTLLRGNQFQDVAKPVQDRAEETVSWGNQH